MPISKKLILYSYDANPDSTAKITSLMKHFQQIAREDLETYNVTYNMMREHNQAFVIIKMKLEINKRISIYDNLILKTVPTKTSGVTFFRDFILTDDTGTVYAAATTAWILMNFETRRILKPSEIISPIPEFPNDANGLTLSRRFTTCDSPISQKTNVRKVLYSNLDENNHLNNVETVSFAIDEVSERLCCGESISDIEIHFNHESVLNDELEINAYQLPHSSLIKAYNKNFGADAFECLINYSSDI